ncbi:VanZ family protein [bacterium]|nr:VanZ family protein [bacterium]
MENSNEKSIQFKYIMPVIGWAILIFIASSIPGTSLPDLGKWSLDKFIHSGVFAVLSGLSFIAIRHYGAVQSKSQWWCWIVSFSFCLLYAASDEVHQLYVPNRSSEILDFLADSIGIVIVHGYQLIFRSKS